MSMVSASAGTRAPPSAHQLTTATTDGVLPVQSTPASNAIMRPPLPKKQNPLVQPGSSPDCECCAARYLNRQTDNSDPIDEELLSRRRLGQTKLTVKPGQIGTSNATKPENLGLFEYAHLRAPLPKDLKGSEIFASHQNQPHPETYFLMVRDLAQRVKIHGLT